MPKLLVFINRSPWNELILRGERNIKYGRNKIKHSGLVLLYTSKSKPDSTGVEEFEQPGEVDAIPRGVIVGACLFKCVAIGGGDYAYHLSDARRFPKPISPPPQRGPVRFYSLTVTPEIERQLRVVGLWKKAIASDRNRLEKCSHGALIKAVRRLMRNYVLGHKLSGALEQIDQALINLGIDPMKDS